MDSYKRITNLVPPILRSASTRQEPLKNPDGWGSQPTGQDDSEIRQWVNNRRPNEERQKAVDTLAAASSSQRVGLANLKLRELPPDRLVSNGTDKAKHLTLAHNQLNAVPAVILSLTNLDHLNISQNQIQTLPETIGNLQNLRSLDLSKNAIEVLPDAIGKLTKLESLDVSTNALTHVSDEIGDLRQLKKLSLQENLLKQIPSAVGKLTRLEEFNLSMNHLTGMPSEIGSLKKLNTLNLANNMLKADDAIPHSVAKLKTLQRLDVSGNPLSWLTVDFGPLQYVSKSKLTIGRQRTKYELSWGKLTINIANTYLPKKLASNGRLPELLGNQAPGRPEFLAPYTAPQLSPGHHRAFETGPDAWSPVQGQEKAHSQRFDFQKHSLNSDSDDELSVRSEAAFKYKGAGGSVSLRFDERMRSPQQDFDGESSRHFKGRSEQRRSQEQPAPRFTRGEHPGDLDSDKASSVRSKTSQAHERADDGASRRFDERPRRTQRDSDSESSHRSEGRYEQPRPQSRRPRQADRGDHSVDQVVDETLSDRSVSVRSGHRGSKPHNKAPMDESYPYREATYMRPSGGHPQRQVHFASGPGVSYQPGMAQGREYQTNGYRPGVTGPTVMPLNTEALLAKLIAVTLSDGPSQPRPSTFQRQYGSRLQEEVAARGTLFDYSVPLYGDPAVHEAITRRDSERKDADNLRALKTRYSIRVEDGALANLVHLAKTVGRSPYDDLLKLGRMMYRQEIINGLAERVADGNRWENENNTNGLGPRLIEDSHMIALAYQSLVYEELKIIPMKDIHDELSTNEDFSAVFASVVAPDQLEFIKKKLMEAVYAEEKNEAKVDDFLNKQPFLNSYRPDYQRSAMLCWNAKYPLN